MVIVSSHLQEDASKWSAMSALGRSWRAITTRHRELVEAGGTTSFLFVEEHFRYRADADAIYGVLVKSVRARLQARSRSLGTLLDDPYVCMQSRTSLTQDCPSDAPLPGSAVGLNLERASWLKFATATGALGLALLFAFSLGANAARK
jgi:hypothetical protein